MSGSGHDRLGGHYKGGHSWSNQYVIKYGHVSCLNVGNRGQECQIRGQFRSGRGHDRLGGQY